MDFYHLGDMMDFGQQQQEMTGTSSHSELHPLFHCENKCRNKPFSLSLFFPPLPLGEMGESSLQWKSVQEAPLRVLPVKDINRSRKTRFL